MSDKDLTRIAALLRKAEGTDNEHEADAYLQAAQRLATLASVDLAVARAHTDRKERRAVPTQRSIVIGESGKRGLRTYVQLFLAIGRANNLTCDIARDSSRVYAFGFDTDIEMVQTLYASLVVQMVRASDAYIKSGDYARELVTKRVPVATVGRGRPRRTTSWSIGRCTPPPRGSTSSRPSPSRIGERLTAARQEAEQQAVERHTGGGTLRRRAGAAGQGGRAGRPLPGQLDGPRDRGAATGRRPDTPSGPGGPGTGRDGWPGWVPSRRSAGSGHGSAAG